MLLSVDSLTIIFVKIYCYWTRTVGVIAKSSRGPVFSETQCIFTFILLDGSTYMLLLVWGTLSYTTHWWWCSQVLLGYDIPSCQHALLNIAGQLFCTRRHQHCRMLFRLLDYTASVRSAQPNSSSGKIQLTPPTFSMKNANNMKGWNGLKMLQYFFLLQMPEVKCMHIVKQI